MTKKSFLTLVSVVALVFMLTGCGNNKKESVKPDTGDTEVVADTDPTDTEVVPDEDLTDLISQKYPEEFTAYFYDSFVPNNIVEQLFGVKIEGEGEGMHKDARIILHKRAKSIQVVMNREMSFFVSEQELEGTIDEKFNEAKNMAEALTLLQLKSDEIARDTNEDFEVEGNVESLDQTRGSVTFVFRPVINGILIFSASIEIEYDAEGFYQLRSNVPYSVSEIRRSAIKSEEQVEEEIYSALGKKEDKIIAYVLNEEGEFILSAVTKDDANSTFLTISLEADHD
jgi:hypothetical protein